MKRTLFLAMFLCLLSASYAHADIPMQKEIVDCSGKKLNDPCSTGTCRLRCMVAGWIVDKGKPTLCSNAKAIQGEPCYAEGDPVSGFCDLFCAPIGTSVTDVVPTPMPYQMPYHRPTPDPVPAPSPGKDIKDIEDVNKGTGGCNLIYHPVSDTGGSPVGG